MQTKILILIASLILSSCARIFNAPDHRIIINVNEDIRRVEVNGKNLRFKKNSSKLNVYRDTIPLRVAAETKDSIYHLSIKNKNSFNYVLWGLLTCGIDWMIEKKQPKRYYYQKNIYLEALEKQINVHRFPPDKKGKILLDFSIPYVNNIYLKTSTDQQHKIGFWGLSTGIDYFYRKNTSLSIQGGIALDYPVPVPVGVDYGHRDTIESWRTSFINLRNNHTIGSFTLGYGLNISKYKWSLTDLRGMSPVTNEITTTNLGLCFAVNYRITKNFRTALMYQPSFLEIENGLQKSYQHLLSLQLQWKFRLN